MTLYTYRQIADANIGGYIARHKGWVYVQLFKPTRVRVYLRACTAEPLYLHPGAALEAAIMDLSKRYDLWDISVDMGLQGRDLTVRVFGRKREVWVLPTGAEVYVKQKRVRRKG